jgi:outer membrane protein W
MKTSNTLFILSLVAALVVLAGLASPAEAAGQWNLRGFGAWVSPDVDFRQADGTQTVRATADGAFGLGLGLEYQLSPRWGLEVGALRASPDVIITLDETVPEITVSTSDNPSFTPLTAGVNAHLTPNAKVDFYIGAFVAYVLHDDLDFRLQAEIPVDDMLLVLEEQVRIKVDNDFGWGALLGLDVPLGDGNWGLTGTLEYLATDLDTTDDDGDRTTIGYDPFIVTFGLVYSF